MKKTVSFLLSAFLACASFMLPVCALEKGVGWYCAHVKDHAQPPVGRDLAFALAEGAYYIDPRHTECDAEEKVVYLTFDVGYENGNVAKTLDVLKAEGVPAAFFVLEHPLTQNTELIRRMVAEGHTVGNHTASHRDMSRLPKEEMLRELRTMETLYREHVGREISPYYRPPEGRFTRENLICAREAGYTTVFWSFAYPDWDNGKQMSPERAKKIILDNLHNGEVMLLHPTSETNALILGDVIAEIKRMGYRFGTLDELTGR